MQTRTMHYLYCLILASHAIPAQLSGMDGAKVYTVPQGKLTAVVSDTETTEYERTRRNMLAHTKVLEQVMVEQTILPVKFGTLAPHKRAIRDKLLRQRQGELLNLLDGMRGKIELGLKVFWRNQVVFDEIVRENQSIRRLRDKLQGRGQAESYYDRIKLGQLIEQALQQKRVEDAAKIKQTLHPLTLKVKEKKTISDEMIVNDAFLLDQAREAEFDQTLQTLDQSFGERMLFKYVGPVPAYNFVSVSVTW